MTTLLTWYEVGANHFQLGSGLGQIVGSVTRADDGQWEWTLDGVGSGPYRERSGVASKADTAMAVAMALAYELGRDAWKPLASMKIDADHAACPQCGDRWESGWWLEWHPRGETVEQGTDLCMECGCYYADDRPFRWTCQCERCGANLVAEVQRVNPMVTITVEDEA
jgi:hypothetical protein